MKNNNETAKFESFEDIRKAKEEKQKELNDWNHGFIRKDLDVNDKELKIVYGPDDNSDYWN